MRKKIAHGVGRLLKIPYPVFVALFIVGVVVSVLALRANNQQMIKLRDEVFASDKAGTGTEEALANLRSYVYSHMNTNLASGGNAIKPPIQLKYTYERLTAAEQAKTEAANSKIYTDAQEYCQAKIPAGMSGSGRVSCVADYVTSHGVKVKAVPAGLYQFDFLNPAWSPDLAGWSLVITTLTLILATSSFIRQRFTG
ncbi:hypothetical protein A3F65_03035 [Candidatus Saccharibacteria bacterium RIFCSPHIGHO2_12_FULL_47_16b]|nr:MAG: hypothetical protein A3F65_03035 [Candidatus Saccharibacteria bacterium RIFCSPHIGHO2_12_FULL_47_16b]